MSTRPQGSMGWWRWAASCSAKHHGGRELEDLGELGAADVGLDQQNLGAAALDEGEGNVDGDGGLPSPGRGWRRRMTCGRPASRR
jgi:hypothetical protein